MEYMVFRARIMETLTSMTDPGEEVRIRQVTKNNGVVFDGITVLIPGCNISPTIYLMELKQRFDNGVPLSLLAEEILSFCRERAGRNTRLAAELMDYRNFRGKVCYRLINRERNRVKLQDMPFHAFLDLAMVYYYSTSVAEGVSGTILVQNSDLLRWGISEETLREDALWNTPRLEPLFSRALFTSIDGFEVRVFTNKNMMNGAGVMLYDGAFTSCEEVWQKDLIILPSSVHEVLVLPETGERPLKEYKQMVKEINEAVVSETDVLSNSVYVRKQGGSEIQIA